MSDGMPIHLLRSIPSVDKLLSDSELSPLLEKYTQPLVKRMVRLALDELRFDIAAGRATEPDCANSIIIRRIFEIAEQRLGRSLRTVINATGVIVHTNLGRSPLSEPVVARIAEAARSYSNLEYNLPAGRRGERNAHLRSLIQELTGADAALAVNNNAAAVLLALSTLAAGREVIVSRGELVEIGGSFRIPEVMARSGAILREVGATNRTHPRDYEQAINDRTALILKVHTSNYRIVGFTREVSLQELVHIGRARDIPTMMDLGSGCLVDLSQYGLAQEPTVQSVIAEGVDVVTFSGDKLLGGPQAGLVVGRSDLVDQMRTNQLARALRMDKLTLAGLEAALEQYALLSGPEKAIPTLAMIMRSGEELEQAAERIAAALSKRLASSAAVGIEPGAAKVGGGASPMDDLPGPRVSIRPAGCSAARPEERLRLGNPPLIALVHEDAVLIDPRTLLHDQESLIPGLVATALG